MNHKCFFGMFVLTRFVYQVRALEWLQSGDLETQLQTNYENNNDSPFTMGKDIDAIGDEKRKKICNLGKEEPFNFLKGMTEHGHDVVANFKVSMRNGKVHTTSAFCCGFLGNAFYYIGVGPLVDSVAVYSRSLEGGHASPFGIMVFAEGDL